MVELMVMKSGPSPTKPSDIQMGCIREVERLHSESHFRIFGEGKVAEQPEVPVEEARTTEELVRGVPKAGRSHVREGTWVIVGGAAADSAQLGHRLDLVCGLVASRQVQSSVVSRD